jgi:hypothetical protein
MSETHRQRDRDEENMEDNDQRELLAARFDRHVDEEGRILGEYRVLSERLDSDSPIGFLIDLILTEEELHHLLLRTMAAWLRSPPTRDQGVAAKAVIRDDLLGYTRRLQQHERETIDACRELKPQLPEEDRAVLESLLDSVVLDSEKHHRLLSAVEKLAEA